MKLVICEKPSVGAAVAAALGVREKKDGYIEGNGYVISTRATSFPYSLAFLSK